MPNGGQTNNREQIARPAPPQSRLPQSSRVQSVHSVASIFTFKKWNETLDQAPILNESRPLSLFYHAGTDMRLITITDRNLAKAIKQLKKAGNIIGPSFARKNERVHKLQKIMLECVYLVYLEMDSSMKANRDYRAQLPPEDQRELEGGFSENILFAAQALSRGFRIRGIESFTADLVESARCLCAATEALRVVFHDGAMNRHLYDGHDHIAFYPVLKDFDAAWVVFEQKICFCYFHVTYNGKPGKSDETQMFQVLLSETILRAVAKGYVTMEQISEYDPKIMFAIPRLAIVLALVHMPDCLNVTDSDTGFRWFRLKANKLLQMKQELSQMSLEKVDSLECMLADCGSLGHERDGASALSIEHSKKDADTVQRLYRDLSAVADDLQCGNSAREFVGLLQKAFSMHQKIC